MDGNVNVQTPLTATWAGGSSWTVSANTMLFAPESFFVQQNDLRELRRLRYRDDVHATARPAQQPSVAPATLTTATASNAGTGTIGGFIKMERENADGTWTDVTMEILNYGIAAPNLAGTNCDPAGNLTPTRSSGSSVCATTTGAPVRHPQGANSVSTDYWPNVLFDTREALQRDVAAGTLVLGGAMHYVSIDATNLSRWFQRAGVYGAGSGNQALTDGEDGGYSVYFSDRRNNRDDRNEESGEFGFEDVVNPASATGAPNNALNAGEDMNANKLLDSYGQFPSFNGAYNTEPTGAQGPLDVLQARPWSDIRAPYAQVNRAVLFRRALKLINGGLGNIVAPGLTIAAENPVYIHGDWNAATQANGSDPFIETNVATSVAGDAVTLLVEKLERQQLVFVPVRGQRTPAHQHQAYRPPSSPARVDLPAAGQHRGALRNRRRRPQLPAVPRGRRRLDGVLPRFDGDVVLPPPGAEPVQVLRCGWHRRPRVRRSPAPLRVRPRFPRPGVAAAADADVPRSECARPYAGDAAGQVVGAPAWSASRREGSGAAALRGRPLATVDAWPGIVGSRYPMRSLPARCSSSACCP